jgi:hypothetical protein
MGHPSSGNRQLTTTSKPPAGFRFVLRASPEARLTPVAWVYLRFDLSGGVADITLPGRPPLRHLPLFPLERHGRRPELPADPHRIGAELARNFVVRSKESGRWRTLAWLCARTDGDGGLADLTVPGAPALLNLTLTPLAPRRSRTSGRWACGTEQPAESQTNSSLPRT